MESPAAYAENVDATDILPAAAWFRSWLKARGVVIHPQSEMARGLASLEEYGRRALATAATRLPRSEARDLYRDALGWNFLIRAIHLAGDALCDEFEKYGGWQKLTGKDVVLSREADQSQMRDVLFELCAAAACSTFATDVRLEDPPDVTMTFGGVRRGLACKVFYSPEQARHEDALVSGAKQLQRSSIDRGYVFMNLASLAPHAEFFPDHSPAPFNSYEELQPKLEACGNAFAGRILDKPAFIERFTKDSETGAVRAKLGGLISWFPTLADVAGSAVNVSWISVAPGYDDAGDRAFELAFHNAWMDVHRHRLDA